VFELPYLPKKPRGNSPPSLLPSRRLGFTGFHVSGIIDNPTFQLSSVTGSPLPSPSLGGGSLPPTKRSGSHISPAVPLRAKYRDGKQQQISEGARLQSSPIGAKVPHTPTYARPANRSRTGASRLSRSVLQGRASQANAKIAEEPPSRKKWR